MDRLGDRLGLKKRPSTRPSLPPSQLQLESHLDESASGKSAKPNIFNRVRDALNMHKKGSAAPTTTRASATDTCIESSLTECNRSRLGSVEDGSAFSEAAPFRDAAQLHMSQDVDKLPVQPPRATKGLSMTVPAVSKQAVRVYGDEAEGESDDAPSSSAVPCSSRAPVSKYMDVASGVPASMASSSCCSFRPVASSPSGASRTSNRSPSPIFSIDLSVLSEDSSARSTSGVSRVSSRTPSPTNSLDDSVHSVARSPSGASRASNRNPSRPRSLDYDLHSQDSFMRDAAIRFGRPWLPPPRTEIEFGPYKDKYNRVSEASSFGRPLYDCCKACFMGDDCDAQAVHFKDALRGHPKMYEEGCGGWAGFDNEIYRPRNCWGPTILPLLRTGRLPAPGPGQKYRESGPFDIFSKFAWLVGLGISAKGMVVKRAGFWLLHRFPVEPADDTCGVKHQPDNVLDGEVRMWVRYETRCVDLSKPMDDSGLLPPEPGQDHTYLNMYPPRHGVAAPMVVETAEHSEDITLEQDGTVVYDEASAAPSVSADIGGTRGVAGVLRRVESACRGVLSTAAAWAIHARDVIATMAHTTAAFAGLA